MRQRRAPERRQTQRPAAPRRSIWPLVITLAAVALAFYVGIYLLLGLR
jgi:hypothetical protein